MSEDRGGWCCGSRPRLTSSPLDSRSGSMWLQSKETHVSHSVPILSFQTTSQSNETASTGSNPTFEPLFKNMMLGLYFSALLLELEKSETIAAQRSEIWVR